MDIPDYESSAGFSIVDYKPSEGTSAAPFDIDCASEAESEVMSIPNFQGNQRMRRERKPPIIKTKEQKKLEKKEREENYKA